MPKPIGNLPNYILLFFLFSPFCVKAQSIEDSSEVGLCPRPELFHDRLTPPVSWEQTPGQAKNEFYINSDDVSVQDGSIDSDTITFKGNVELFRGRKQIRADMMNFNNHDGEKADTAEVYGDVNYWDSYHFVRSDEAYFKFVGQEHDLSAGDEIEFINAKYIAYGKYYSLVDVNVKNANSAEATVSYGYNEDSASIGFSQGQAKSLYVVVDELLELRQGNYSTCPLTDNFWSMVADRITLDYVKKFGYAKHAIFKIKNTPVLYVPYFHFSFNQHRKSGFLVPSYGRSTRNGFLFSLPYYWNIAPNMDATFTAQQMTKSGTMLTADYRYLFKNSFGGIRTEYLIGNQDANSQHEYLFSFNHKQSFLGANISMHYNYTSYQRYLEDFGNGVSFTSTQYLDRELSIEYHQNRYWQAGAFLKSYQTIDPNIPVLSRPYQQLPRIYFRFKTPVKNGNFNYKLNSELIHFYRGAESSDEDNVTGVRLDFFPSVSYPIKNSAAYITPNLGLRYTQYKLDETGPFISSPSRLLPTFSIDAGFFLERDFSFLGHELKQSLDPRIFYVYVPYKDQSHLPVFDTDVSGFSQAAFFLTDRFNGPDRMGDTHQITIGGNTRIFDLDSGRSFLEGNLTQIFYFSDRRVVLPNGSGQDDDRYSLLIGGLKGTLNNWETSTNIQWDPKINEMVLFSSGLKYQKEDRSLTLDYRSHQYDDTIVRQVTSIFNMRLSKRFNMIGSASYELEQKSMPTAFFGLEYESCCWGMRFVVSRFLTSSTGEHDFLLFYQFHLKGLGSLGNDALRYFRRVPGYVPRF